MGGCVCLTLTLYINIGRNILYRFVVYINYYISITVLVVFDSYDSELTGAKHTKTLFYKSERSK